jgi:pyruvate dehydrogenase E2 component (dihydrolipoamide acetyltransferase)
MPALGMAQETGRLISWLKQEGERVTKGEAIMEIETDKATVEIEANDSGTLSGIAAQAGEDVPVGQTIAWILGQGESIPEEATRAEPAEVQELKAQNTTPMASPLAQKIAAQHSIDLADVKASGGRIQKADVLAYVEAQKVEDGGPRLTPASPKARRLAAELSLDLENLIGSGPGGAILAADVLAAETVQPAISPLQVSMTWRRMAERVTQSWQSAPHFYLMRDVNASQLLAWRVQVKERSGINITITDLLVRLTAAALREHPRVNAAWIQGEITLNRDINIGLAVAVEEGLFVPVMHQADKLNLSQISERRQELIDLAQSGKLGLGDLQGGTFTISNLGMYGVDIFNAVLNPPQAGILAVGSITERVVPVGGQPAVEPMLMLSLTYDHRVVDGARGAQFLQTLAANIENPLRLLE